MWKNLPPAHCSWPKLDYKEITQNKLSSLSLLFPSKLSNLVMGQDLEEVQGEGKITDTAGIPVCICPYSLAGSLIL